MRIAIALALLTTSAYPADLRKLEFMAGCWETPAAGASPMRTDEHWSKPASGTMLGYSRTFRGDRMVFFEFMRLEVNGEQIIYTPRIGTSQKPVAFRLTKLTSTEAIFENPEHDFPQRILYRREGNKLIASIDGKDKGKPHREEFPYSRVACP